MEVGVWVGMGVVVVRVPVLVPMLVLVVALALVVGRRGGWVSWWWLSRDNDANSRCRGRSGSSGRDRTVLSYEWVELRGWPGGGCREITMPTPAEQGETG